LTRKPLGEHTAGKPGAHYEIIVHV
jgi:hypothetical protein